MEMPDIDRRRRFVFRGNAAAIGGRIVRPEDVVLESHVASSLTVAGGRSSARGHDIDFSPYVKLKSATTSAEGLFDDVKQHAALTYRRVTADALTTTTRVFAEVVDLQAGLKPILTIKHLHAALTATSPAASGEPAIRVDATIGGVEIGGHRLKLKLSPSVFQQYDTHSKVMVAADDSNSGLRRFLLMHSDIQGGRPLPPIGRLLRAQDTIYATVVESIEWDGAPFSGSTITDHTVRVPGFGKIVFGELLLTSFSRRLTLLRLELGSPEGGDVACAEVESNGIWT